MSQIETRLDVETILDALKKVVLYMQREKHRLPDKHHEFIDDMAGHIVRGGWASPAQLKYLRALFLELGGKII